MPLPKSSRTKKSIFVLGSGDPDSGSDWSDSASNYAPDEDSASESEPDEENRTTSIRAFTPTDLEDNIDNILEPQDEADIDDVAKQIQNYYVDHPALPLDGDDLVDIDELHNGNLHPPEHYRQGITATVEDNYRRKVYAKGTEKLIVHAETQWRLYCEQILQSTNPVACLEGLTFPILFQFLRWYLAQMVNKNGTRKRQVKSKQSLITFWCNFRLGVERTVNVKVDKLVDRRLICNALAQLGRGLNHNVRANRSMTINDLKLMIETTLTTTEKAFRLGEIRILTVLFLLLLAPQGSRPAAILQLQFKHIGLSLVRDPKNPNGPPRLTVRLNLEYTKTYLGPKAMKSFIMPEIIYDPSLLLSPHVFLLAILFRHKAFLSDELNENPSLLGTMPLYSDEPELRLGLKHELRETYVFRRGTRLVSGWSMGTSPISLPMMSEWISRLGMLAGFEFSTIAYSLRYMAGNSLDQNVNISDALRNLVMDHAPNSDTFQKHYLNRFVCADLMAIHRGMEPQHALIQQATSHGASVSSRRPTKLETEQVETLKKQDQHYQQLGRQLLDYPKTSETYRKIQAKRRAHLDRITRIKLTQIREEWSEKQGVEDVARHVRGEATEKVVSTRSPMRRLQQRMFDALTAPLVNDYAAQMRRRTAAIQALVAYCSDEDPVTTKVVKAPVVAPVEPSLGLSPQEKMEEIKKSTLVEFAGKDVRKCFICVARAEQLGMDHDSFDSLCRHFSRAGTLARHFISTHLDALAQDEMYECPICQVTLIHKTHLRSHSDRVHGICTDIVFRRPSKRF